MTDKQQSLYATIERKANGNISCTLEYHILSYISTYGNKLFGVKVDKLDSTNSIVDSKEVLAVTDSYDTVVELAEYLSVNMIMPGQLDDMHEEWESNNVWRPTPPNAPAYRMAV